MPSKSGYAKVNGTWLYYEEQGEGEPLALVHSGLADHTMWDAQVSAFARNYRVIRYDLRGFGRSDLPPGAFSMRADLADLLTSLNATPAHVVGLSLGGSTGLGFTIEYPDLVRSLVVAAPGLLGQRPAGATRTAFDEIESVESAGDLDRANELEVRLWVDGLGQPPTRVKPELRERILRLNRANLARSSDDALPVPLVPSAMTRLAEIHVPTLVMVGELDLAESRAAATRLTEGIAGAKNLVVPNVAHLINLEDPEGFNRAVLEFLAEATPKDP